MSRALSVGVAGLGTVGAGLLKLLRDNAEVVAARAGRPIAVTAVSARDRARDRGVPLGGLRWYEDAVALAGDPAVDVVVELIGGADGTARALVERAIAAGKPVVTANKAMLAVHGAELASLAEAAGVPLAFEAAVAGGIPVIKAVREGLAGNNIARIAGILNGTCNYILTRMRDEGREFAEILADAQRLGLRGGGPFVRYRRGGCGAQAGDPGSAGVWAAGGVRRGARGRDPRGFSAGYRVCRGAGVPDQAAGDRSGVGWWGGGAGASVHGAEGGALWRGWTGFIMRWWRKGISSGG